MNQIKSIVLIDVLWDFGVTDQVTDAREISIDQRAIKARENEAKLIDI